MSQSQVTPSNSTTIDRPTCRACGTQMWLVSVEPDAPGHHKRTFECPSCSASDIALVNFK